MSRFRARLSQPDVNGRLVFILRMLQTFAIALLTSWVVLLPAAQAKTGSSACAGQTINSVRLLNCKNTKCANKRANKRLLTLTDIEPGKTKWTAKLVELATKRLSQTGFFKTIEAQCLNEGGKAVLGLKVVGNSFIYEVKIAGDYHFFKSEIFKRVFLRPGRILNYPDQQAKLDLQRQKRSLMRRYIKEGFYDTRINFTTKRSRQYRITLTIHIQKGRKLKLKKLLFVFDRKKPAFSKGRLRKVIRLSIGSTYTDRKRREARKKLKRFYRLNGYSGVKIAVNWLLAEQQLTVKIQSKSARKYEILFKGNRSVSSDKLRTLLPFAETGVFVENEARRDGLQAIKKHYETKGYLFVKVELKVTKRTFLFTINENAKAEIRAIRFFGNKHFKRAALLKTIQTKEWDFFDEGGFVQIERVFQDLLRIRQLYNHQGFYNFAFKHSGGDEPRVVREDKSNAPCLIIGNSGRDRRCTQYVYTYTYRKRGFQVIKRKGDVAVYLHIYIKENRQSRVTDLEIKGNKQIKRKEIRKLWTLNKGKAFSRFLLIENLNRLAAKYHSLGFHQVKLAAACRTPTKDEKKCDPRTVTHEKVALKLIIEEGPRLQVGEILLHGNSRTIDHILLRDFPKSGSPFDRQKLLDAQKKLRDLGIFRRVHVDYIGLEEKPPRKKIAMVISVEEDSSQFLDFSVGFETFNRTSSSQFDSLKFPSGLSSAFTHGTTRSDQSLHGFGKQLNLDIPDLLIVGRVEYINKNLFGRAWELRIPLELGMSMTSKLPRLISLKVTWIDTRFMDTDLNVRVTPLFTWDRASETFDQLKLGLELEGSKQLYRGLLLSVLVEFQGIKTKTINQSKLGAFRPQLSVTPTLTFNRLDNPIHPTSGYWLGASISYLLANGDNFVKWSAEAKFVFSIRKKYIFAFYVRYADGKSFSSKILPLTERFKLGGGRNVRGYGNDAIGQYSSSGRLLNPDPDRVGGDTVVNGSFEFRLPIVQKLGIWGALFADVGGLADSVASYTSSSFRSSLGFGVRYLVGNQIPIRLDYAFILDRRCTGVNVQPLGSVNWSCSRKEPLGTFHLEILYSF